MKLNIMPNTEQKTTGMIGRVNGTLVRINKKLAADKPLLLDEYLPCAATAYMFITNSTTGFIPFKLLYERHANLPG